MAATNIFYRIPSQRGTRVVSLAGDGCTLDQFCNYIVESEGLGQKDFIIASGTKIFRPNSCKLQSVSLQNNSHLDILIPLIGGKGGFGSLLRAIGAQIEKTTNRDACRDLSGRRLRDIKREEELRELIALREKLEEERKRRKKEKLEKLKKKTSEISTASTSIQELVQMFDDYEYNKRRLEINDIIDAAVEKGIINFKKRKLDEAIESEVATKKTRTSIDQGGLAEKSGELGSKGSTSIESGLEISSSESESETPKNKISVYKQDLWLGLEDEDL